MRLPRAKGLYQRVNSGPLTARQMFERQWINEGRDDLMTSKIGKVEPETKSYARMTSKSIMDQPGGTSEKWRKSLNLRKAITNQRGPLKGGLPGSKIFPAMDMSETTSGGKLPKSPKSPKVARASHVESAAEVVDKMLDN